MKIDHIAIWTENLELLKEFYIQYFEGVANLKYTNPITHFESYFITFKSGARLELMYKPAIPVNTNDTVEAQHQGLIHLAFDVGSKAAVDQKANQFKSDGVHILNGPRTTGDGYYEFVCLDPDKNRIEIITKEIVA